MADMKYNLYMAGYKYLLSVFGVESDLFDARDVQTVLHYFALTNIKIGIWAHAASFSFHYRNKIRVILHNKQNHQAQNC